MSCTKAKIENEIALAMLAYLCVAVPVAAKELHDDDAAAIGSAPVVCAHDRVQHLNMKWPQRDYFFSLLLIYYDC